jgi:hypothetical protein
MQPLMDWYFEIERRAENLLGFYELPGRRIAWAKQQPKERDA